MFNWISKLFKQAPVETRIAFIDGDQPLPEVLRAYHQYVKGTNTETHLVRAMPDNCNPPKALRKADLSQINKIYLTGYTTKKEVTDKYIAALIQKAITDHFTHITVISSDYDFIDIFKMAVSINPTATNVTFRMIVPHAQGRLVREECTVANIEVVRC